MKIVKYVKDFGEYSFPDGFKELLERKSVEEQLNYFRISNGYGFFFEPWRQRKNSSARFIRVEKSCDVKGVIVDNGLIVGVMIENAYGKDEPCFIDRGVTTWDASDNNGAGYKERCECAIFIAVPEDFMEK